MTEKIFVMGIVFFVTTIVARYLGPEQYGMLSYAISISGIFAVSGHMGLAGLITREIVKKNSEKNKILGTSLVLKFFGAAIGFFVLIFYAFLFERKQSIEFWTIFITSFSLLFRPFDVIDFWFQAHVQAKYTAIARGASVLFSAIFKLGMVFVGANVLLFAFAVPLQSFLLTYFLILLFHSTSKLSITKWRCSLHKAKELLNSSWIIFFGALFATINFKIDQVMLKWFIGAKEVGVYAIAATLSEVWYFVPTAIVSSFYPRFIKLKEDNQERYQYRLQQVFELLFFVALLVAILMTFIAEPVVGIFFGKKYYSSISILNIHIWASLFIFMRAAFSQWILIEDALFFSLITQVCGALVNIGLNLLLIPKYGGQGAAIATLLSYAVSSYFSLLFYSKSRVIFWMMTKAIFAPVIYPLLYVKRKI